MKQFTKIAAVVLALAMVVCAMAGCGKNNDEGVYQVGATGPLTGDASQYGTSVQKGASLAFEEINNNGGLNGKQFNFTIQDDKATAADAASGYDTLFDNGMQISLGSVTSGSCEAFAARAAADNLFFITPSASAANVIADRPNAFRVCFGDPDQGVLAAENLTKSYTNIGAIYDSSDDYSSGIYKAFEEKMNQLGVAFTVRTFDADNKTDFSAQVEALKDCDVIFLPIYYTEAGLIARACNAKGLTELPLFGCDGLDGVAGTIDASVKNPISYITPFDVNSTEAKAAAFVKAYEAKYNEKPDQFAADGYDAAYVIYEAMKAAGVDDTSISASDLCNLVVKVMTGDSFRYAGVTGNMKWDASGACTKDPIIVTLNK